MADDDSADQGPGNPEGGAKQPEDPPALKVIQLFGGIRPMAQKLGVAVSTVQGWRERGVIPEARHAAILEAARKNGIALRDVVLAATGQQADAKSASGAASGKDSSDRAAQDNKAEQNKEPFEGDKVTKDDSKSTGSKSGGSVPPSGSPAKDSTAKDNTGKERATKDTAAASALQSSAKKEPGKPASAPIPPSGSKASPPPAAKSKSSGAWIGGIVLGAAIFAGGLIAAVMTREVWLPHADRFLGTETEGAGETAAPVTADMLEAVQQRVTALESALDSSERTDAPEVSPDVTALQDQISDFATRLAALEVSEPAAPADAGEGTAVPVDDGALADLSGRLDDLEGAIAALSAQPAAMGTGEAGTQEGAAAGADLTAQLAETRAVLDELSAELEAVTEEAGAQQEALEVELAELEEQNRTLTERLGAAEQVIGGLPDLEARVSQSGADFRRQASGDTAMVLAVLQLRDALRGSAPYGAALQSVEKISGGDAEVMQILAPLSGRASEGLPTLSELKGSFPAVARDIVAAGRTGDGEGFWSGVVDQVSKVVSVRSVGMVEGEGPEAIAARAEVKLDGDDLAGAVAELKSLQGAAAEAAAGWLGDAEGRVAASEAMTSLAAKISAQLDAPEG